MNPLNSLFCGLSPPLTDQDCDHQFDQQTPKMATTQSCCWICGWWYLSSLLCTHILSFSFFLFPTYLHDIFILSYCSVSIDNNQNSCIAFFQQPNCSKINLTYIYKYVQIYIGIALSLHIQIHKLWSLNILSL